MARRVSANSPLVSLQYEARGTRNALALTSLDGLLIVVECKEHLLQMTVECRDVIRDCSNVERNNYLCEWDLWK